MHALGSEFGSGAQLSKRLGSVWNCLWGNALKRSPGIIRKSRVSYPGPGFHTHACTHTHTRIHHKLSTQAQHQESENTHTHARTHTHAHTHTHTHTQSCIYMIYIEQIYIKMFLMAYLI